MNYPEIPLPRLLTGSGATSRFIRPISVEINEKITPLSYASMTLPQDESVPGRSYVELFTSNGSAGVFRVTSPQDAFGEDVVTCELEHAITEVGDWLFGEEFSEMVPAKDSIGRIFGHYRGNKWQLGSTTALGTDQIALDASYQNILECILNVLDQVPDCMMTFDFSTSPWTFAFAKKGTSVTAEGRLSRNVTSATVTYDDSSLCTRAFYQYYTTDSDGNSESHWTHKDADTRSTYGTVERTVSTGSDYDANEAEYIVDLYLAKHKKPLVTVSIEALELSSITGESLDTFTLGKKFRLALPDYNVDSIEDVITGISWKGLYSGFESVTVTLGDQEDGVVTFLHDVDSSGGSSSGGRASSTKARKEKEEQKSQFESRINKTDDTISLLVGFSSVSSSQIHSFAHKSDFPDRGRGVEGDIYLDRSTGQAYKLYNERYIPIKLTDNGDGTYYVGAGGITTNIDDNGIVSSHVDADRVILGRLSNEDLSTWAQGAVDGTGVFAKFVTMQSFNAVRGHVDNLTGGTIIENFCKAQLVVGTTVTANNTFVHAGDTIYKRALRWTSGGTAIATVHALGDTTSIILNHSHAMSVSSGGVVTIGDAQTTSGTFNIADTAFYKTRVASAWNSGGSTAQVDQTSQRIPYKGSLVIKVQYRNYDGDIVDANKSITIWTSECSHTFGEREISSNGTFYASTYGYSGFSKVIVSGVRTSKHTYCAEGLTKYGEESIVYVPDSSGITISTKVKNISQANRCWYYGSDQSLFTAYT